MKTNQLPTTAAPAALPAIVFDHAGHTHPIRTARDPKGHMQWVARDVCEALGITKQSRALERVNPADKGRTKLSTPGGLQDFVTVNKSGLFALAFQSRKPAARAFQHWVTSVVLPAIAEDGAYIRGEEKVLQATTAGELQAHQQAMRATTERAIEVKERRGLCALEERDARSSGFALLNGKSHRVSFRGAA
ncbi:MAG: Bro-N domain-containing protein [Hydrogenophaga sp.]|uniref:BRO-N domain-containing protein n=1 Tax=Hydrogenophaga sp. TaxID=1904254 RepID=UPI002721A9E8|nr:Bro-N domain-containing protein [Hydrogenophaga sp.]MDO9031197.1 Bro-N domain-containing protein [Hydrogenophaga sp.]